MIHEFVCADCESDVFSYGGDQGATLCSLCETVREMKAREEMTPEDEATLRAILGCVLPVKKGPTPGTLEILSPPRDEP